MYNDVLFSIIIIATHVLCILVLSVECLNAGSMYSAYKGLIGNQFY